MWRTLTIVGLLAVCSAAAVGQPLAASLEWSTFLGGSSGDTGPAVAIAADGSIFVAGYTTSDDFPVTGDAYDDTYNLGGAVGRDIYLARLSADGSQLLYATYLGGSADDLVAAVVVDEPTGDVLVAGRTLSPDFPTTFSYGPTGDGGVFVARFGNDGTFMQSTRIRGSGVDNVRDLLLEPSGSVLLLGDSSSADLPVTGGVADVGTTGASDFPTTGGAYNEAFNLGISTSASDAFRGPSGHDHVVAWAQFGCVAGTRCPRSAGADLTTTQPSPRARRRSGEGGSRVHAAPSRDDNPLSSGPARLGDLARQRPHPRPNRSPLRRA